MQIKTGIEKLKKKNKLMKRGGCGLCLPEDMYVVQSSPSTNRQRLR